MSRKKIICIGCGGSRQFLETMARCGIGEFVLIDGDVVEDTNIATQGTFISEIGKYKTEVIRDRILDINPLAKVTCINRYLDDTITDEEFCVMTKLKDSRESDTLICGCTDSFEAQDRCAQLSVKYCIAYLAAQIFAGGKGHEVIYTYPGLTKSCPRCMLASKYNYYFNNKDKAKKGSASGAAVCVTDYVNAIKSYTALNILCYNEASTPYYHKLRDFGDCNYLMTKCSDSFTSPAFEPLEELGKKETDLRFPFATIAIEQTPEKNCPLCKGRGHLDWCRNSIRDTRYIIEIKTNKGA